MLSFQDIQASQFKFLTLNKIIIKIIIKRAHENQTRISVYK